MPTNIEIKARVHDFGRFKAEVESIGDGPAEVLDQVDVFFGATGGRLKLRTEGDSSGELIFYRRESAGGPRPSRYSIAPTSDPAALESILGSVLGVLGVVKKRRRLYRVGQTRVHLNRVEGLGDFVELEVVLRHDQPEGDGVNVARGLMGRLGIGEDQLVAKAYIDLLGDGP